MTPKDVKDYYRSNYNFSKCTGMVPPTLGNWIRRGYVPKNAQYRLEVLTKGELKTEWTTENLEEKDKLTNGQ